MYVSIYVHEKISFDVCEACCNKYAPRVNYYQTCDWDVNMLQGNSYRIFNCIENEYVRYLCTRNKLVDS